MSVYFDTYVNSKTKKTVARGKLVYRVYNLRRKLVENGVIPSTSRVLSDSEPGTSAPSIDKSVAASLCILEQSKSNKSNWAETLEHWKKTSQHRMYNLIHGESPEGEDPKNPADGNASKKGKETSPKKAYAYLKKYPAFQEDSAFVLFEMDFATLRPEVDPLPLFTEWADLSSFIIEQVQKKEPVFFEDQTLTQGEKVLMVLVNFSKIFSIVNIPTNAGDSTRSKRQGKKTWRPTHAEAADAFVQVFPTIIAFEEFKDEKRDHLRKYNLSLQPFVGVVGEMENPQQYLVSIDEFFYEVGSVLKAVDVVFKAFFALDTPYPAEAFQMWLFLQREVYGIKLKTDPHYVSVNALGKEYHRFKNRKSNGVQ